MLALLDVVDKTFLSQCRLDRGAGFHPIEAGKPAAIVVHFGLDREDVDDVEAGPLSYFEVGGIVGGCDFDGARPKLGVDH